MKKQLSTEIEAFRTKRKELIQPVLLTQDPMGFSFTYSCALEELLIKTAGESHSTAVLACGSFGRRELSPYSDINLLVLGREPRLLNEATHNFRDVLAAAGVTVHIFAINTGEDFSFLFFNPKYLTQIFEIRFICGNSKLWEDWQTAIVKSLSVPGKQIELLHKILSNNKERHDKFGTAPGLVEPHIKLSAGGLRDLHIVEWLISLQQGEYFGEKPDTTKTHLFNSIMVSKGIISEEYAQETIKAYSFVLAIRHAIHYITGRRADRLTIELQNKVAKLFGYENNGFKELMQQYYTAAGFINRVSRSYLKFVQGRSSRSLPDALVEELDGGYRIRGEVLELDAETQITTETLFQGYYYRGSRKIILDMDVRYRFLEYIASGPEEKDPGAIYYFRKILQMPSDTGSVIRSLSEAGALELLIPEFAECRGYFTPSFRHGYTVDEHTVRSIETVEQFEEMEILPGRVLLSIEKREPLYLSLLFHDLAKPFGNEGHEIMGASIAEAIMERLGYDNETSELVSFLVKNHYLLPEFAYLHDPYHPLAAEHLLPHIPSVQHLDLLYVLTYADLLSASSFIKTSWKEERLTALYRRIRALMEDDTIPETTGVEKSKDEFYDKLNDELTAEELDLAKELAESTDGPTGNQKSSVFFAISYSQSTLRISVITNDKPFLLSNLCAIFILNGFSILNIRAFTKRDNIVFDAFTLQRLKDQPVTDDIVTTLKNEIISLQNGFLSVTDEMHTKFMRQSLLDTLLQLTRQKPVLSFSSKDMVTRIKLTTTNRQGLVYFIANRLGQLNFEIVLASVLVNGEEFQGEFYIKHRFGTRITPNFYPVIEAELSKVIQELTS